MTGIPVSWPPTRSSGRPQRTLAPSRRSLTAEETATSPYKGSPGLTATAFCIEVETCHQVATWN